MSNTTKNFSSEDLKAITSTILSQLGGQKFIVMTGSKNFGFSENKKGNAQLSFHLSRNKAKAQFCTIELTGMDLYNMSFTKLNKKTFELETVKEATGFYHDNLQEVFTRVTGLYTSL